MKTIVHNYRNGRDVIPKNIADGVISAVSELDYSLGKYGISHFKKDLSEQLKVRGWSDKAKLSAESSISITSTLKNIGLCTQTGNMARMYADLLKLQALYMDEKIKAAIFVLPTKECAISFGGNIANYDRFLNELTNVFSRVITVPMVIVGFDNEEGGL